MKLTGAQALIKSLEMEGVEVVFGLPGGCILPAYDPLLDSSIRHILVRHEQGAGHMAEGYAHVTGRPGVAMVTSGPAATNLVTPLCDAYMDSIPMVAITGQVSTGGHRHRRLPGVRHRRHHPLGHQAQRAGDERRTTCPAPSARRSTSPRPAVPGPSWSTCRRTCSRSSMEWYWPDGGRPARLQAHAAGPSPHDPRGGQADPGLRAADPLRRRRHPEGPGRRGAARAGRADPDPRRHHAHGPRRLPRLAPAVPRHAGHARQRHRHHVDAEGRPADRARRPLRRPHHRQGGDVRPRGQDHPRRHRPGRAGQGAPARRADRGRLPPRHRGARRRAAQAAGRRRGPGRHVGLEEPHQRLARALPAHLRALAAGRRAEAAVLPRALRDLGAAGDDPGVRRRPAPDVVVAVLAVRAALHVGELGRPRHDGLLRCRPPSAPRSAGRTARCGPSTATAASR